MLSTDIFYESNQEDFSKMRSIHKNLLFISRVVGTYVFDVPSNKDVVLSVSELLDKLFEEWSHAVFLQVDVFDVDIHGKYFRTRRFFVNQKLKYFKSMLSLSGEVFDLTSFENKKDD